LWSLLDFKTARKATGTASVSVSADTVNRIHDTKHATGIYQAVLVDEIKEEALEHAPEGAYVARPNEVYFRCAGGGGGELLSGPGLVWEGKDCVAGRSQVHFRFAEG
jgi:hypothetical protein